MIHRFFLCLVFLHAAARGQADLAFAPEGGDTEVVTATLVSEMATIEPGRAFTAALVLDHAPKWHTYYVNPGQAGFPPSVSWDLPEGFEVSPLRFPTPKLGEFAGAPFYGYEGRTAFPVTVTPPAGLAAGTTLTLRGEASWLACKESCIPGEAQVETRVRVGDREVRDRDAAGLFTMARAAMPVTETDWSVTAAATADELILTLTQPGPARPLGDLYFFSADGLTDSAAAPEVRSIEAGYELRMPLQPELEDRPAQVTGIVRAAKGWSEGGATGWRISVPLGSPAEATASQSEALAEMSIGLVLLLMFVGGLILNLMPCVFPVIGLKIMGFVQQAGHEKSKIVTHGLVFTGGVLISFWVLAGILLAGGIRNWGGQLENPLVVFILMLVMLILALSMYGVFEIGTSATSVGGSLATQQGLGGTFFSGVLATVVATPCSAPLLGGALGVAVTLPPLGFMGAFTLMALGLSLPYLLLSIFPKLVERLPRPGPWMESFKQGMSFLLFGTAAFLLWVYSYQVFDQNAGQKGLWVMLGLALVAAGFWVYGRWDLPSRPSRTRWIGRAVALLLVGAGVGAGWPEKPAQPSQAAAAKIDWQDWSLEKQKALIAADTPVYVDFTARWCLTCQTNKAATYTAAMAEFFQQHGIVALRADKTTTRPDIDRELRRLGKSAIPVNVFYPAGSSTPQVTQTVLTESYLRGFLQSYLRRAE